MAIRGDAWHSCTDAIHGDTWHSCSDAIQGDTWHSCADLLEGSFQGTGLFSGDWALFRGHQFHRFRALLELMPFCVLVGAV